MWSFRSPEHLQQGDSMTMSLMPRLNTGGHGVKASQLLRSKAFRGKCNACGKACRTRYGDMKMELPTSPCDAPMDVGFHTLYRVPQDMPDVTFSGRTKMHKKNGKIMTDLK